MGKLKALAKNIVSSDRTEDEDLEGEEEEEEALEEEEEEEDRAGHAGLALLAEKIASGEPLDDDDILLLEEAKEEELYETSADMAAESPETQSAEEVLGTELHDESAPVEGAPVDETEVPPLVGDETSGAIVEALEGSTEEDVQANADGLADTLEEEASVQDEEVARLEEEEEPDEDAIAAGKQRAITLRALAKTLLSGE